MLGTYVLSAGYYDAYYLKAQQVRTLILRDYDQALRAASTWSRCRRARRRRSGSASASTIRCRCIWRTSSRSAPTWPGCRRSACRAASPRDRPADRPAADRAGGSTKRRCSASPTPTSATPHGRNSRHRRSRTAETGRLDDVQRREAARGPHVRSRAHDRGHGAGGADRAAQRRARSARPAFRPHYWLSDEWFTPDGVPGIAIPFYLAHPRLAKLERAEMLEVEGGDPESCMRILRHEAGHAIDNAYRLQRRPTRRRLFGDPTSTYPDTTRRSRTARASSSTSITGTRRAIPTKTSPRRSPSGSIPARCGRRATRAGRRSASSNTWTG